MSVTHNDKWGQFLSKPVKILPPVLNSTWRPHLPLRLGERFKSMWDLPNHKLKVHLRALRAARKSAKRNRVRIRMQRASCVLRITDGFASFSHIVPGRILLNDFTKQGIKIFSQDPLLPGQEVAITIEDPRYFYAHGRVMWSSHLGFDRKVLTDRPFDYRVGIKFVFNSPSEQKAIADYCDYIWSEHLILHL